MNQTTESVYSLLLGLVQGVTEFLPISSSGHLSIIQSLMGNEFSGNVYFGIVLHMGTLLAVLIFMRKQIWEVLLMFKNPFSKRSALLHSLLLGTLVTAVFIIFFKKILMNMFSTPKVAGWALLFTGGINILAQVFLTKNKNSIKTANPASGAFVGLMQGFAAIPGISRSGATILAGGISGLSPEKAFNFSFLLSLPAIGGAFILETISGAGGAQSLPMSQMIIGFLAALISGYFALKLLRNLVNSGKYYLFGIYAIIAGLVTVIFI